MAEKKITMTKLNRSGKGAIGDAGFNERSMTNEYTNEFLLELQGRQGSLAYQKMASDSMIGMMLTAYKNPIKSANWTFVLPDDATPQETLAADVLKKWFADQAPVLLQELISQKLSLLEYGFSCFERLWQPMQFQNRVFILPDLQQRMQTSIDNIYPTKGYAQQITKEKGYADIPLDQMVFYTLNKQGNDYRGQSLIRTSYQNWKEKVFYKVYLNIAMQRTASGIPWMEVPEGTDPDSEDYIATETLLQNITTHENAYMITKKGFEFDIKNFPTEPEKIMNVIDKLDEKNAVSVLVQFILLGTQGNTGAFALSRDHSDMFLDGLMYVVSYLESVFHRAVISPFLKYNFGTAVDPDNVRLRGLNINKKAGAELADTLNKLSTPGFIKATIDDEIQLRKHLELPELSEEEISRRRERQENPPNPPTSPPNNPPAPNGQEENQDGQNGPTGGSTGAASAAMAHPAMTAAAVKLAERSASARKKILAQEQKQLQDVMRANLLIIKDKLMADIKTALNQGRTEIKGLNRIEVSPARYAKTLERKLAGIAKTGWDGAKARAKARGVKLSEPISISKLDSATLKAFVKNQAELLAEDHVSAMKIKALLTATSGPIKKYSTSQTMGNVDRVIDQFIDSQKISTGASLMVVGGINFGETEFFKEVEDQIWGYRFVAIDDDRTTQICSWYSGKTFSVNSAAVSEAAPPLHPNCRSYLDPIFKSEVAEKPEINDAVAPPSTQKQKSVF
jgi:phage gp29-like protein